MKSLLFIAIVIVGILASVYCYRIGYAHGQAACPVKYAICENGTCVLSDKAPGYPGK